MFALGTTSWFKGKGCQKDCRPGQRSDERMRIVSNRDPPVVDVACLQRWASTPPRRFTDYSAEEPPNHSRSPFPYDEEINSRICLWEGDISILNADAIVHSTNESLTERNPISDKIYRRAGPGLMDDILHEVKECRTGEVKITQGHKLPCRYIIHTVGPKYNIKYKTAAVNTLHTCYRNVLQKAKELGLSSLGLCPINSVRRNYPPDEGAHIALRTVRRFLEKFPNALKVLVLIVDSSDASIYDVILPLYFPRTKKEEKAAMWLLPADVGGVYGEPQLPERRIRIIDNPQHTFGEKDLDFLGDTCRIGEHVFSQMQEDLDQQRLLGERPRNEPACEAIIKEILHKERYERLLQRAKTEDLSSLLKSDIIRQCGYDKNGRQVISIMGKWFIDYNNTMERTVLYLTSFMEDIIKRDFIIVYFNTRSTSQHHPTLQWLKMYFLTLPQHYKKNLKEFYIVHPTLWTKAATLWFTVFTTSATKPKIINVEKVEHLYDLTTDCKFLDPLPAFIMDEDRKMWGPYYYQPRPDFPDFFLKRFVKQTVEDIPEVEEPELPDENHKETCHTETSGDQLPFNGDGCRAENSNAEPLVTQEASNTGRTTPAKSSGIEITL